MKKIRHNNHSEIRQLLLGHRIVEITDGRIWLDNGVEFEIAPNEGCAGCNSGWYELTQLNDVDNVITAVEFEEGREIDDDGDSGSKCTYSVFVIAEDRRLLFAVEGDDGNGYYGTGYRLLVTPPAS